MICDRRRLLILLCLGATKSLFDVVISTNGFILEDHFGHTVEQTAVFTAAFAVACAMGSMVSTQMTARPTTVLWMFIPVLLLSATLLILAGIFSESIVAYLSSISCLQLVVMPPIMAYHAEFSQELQDIVGMATSVDLCAQYLLSSAMSLVGVFAATYSTKSMLFVLAGTVALTELITLVGICPRSSSTGPT